jgi:hypothetical protein
VLELPSTARKIAPDLKHIDMQGLASRPLVWGQPARSNLLEPVCLRRQVVQPETASYVLSSFERPIGSAELEHMDGHFPSPRGKGLGVITAVLTRYHCQSYPAATIYRMWRKAMRWHGR